ncbi:MAG TPA: hypothetical protein VFV89_01520 [Nocardioides sp.]|uniref:hypothetical protein n=1 Tax=Nocardioides sp. TaxID=35761 RepID=UPI002E37D5D8|nr:hypothetical protein [Nocardioides sp.]HEX5086455.1 hypothetical protein [Nocardioides sp.]
MSSRPKSVMTLVVAAVAVAVSTAAVGAIAAPAQATQAHESTSSIRAAHPRVAIVADRHHGRRIPTSLSIRAAHRIVGEDGRDLVRGRLRTHGIGLRNRVVDLLTRTAADPTWQVIGQDLTDRAGAVRFAIRPSAPAAYRLAFEGTQVFRPSHSGIVRIGVRPAVTALAAPDTVDPGETTTVSGVATLAGRSLGGATVDLVARAAGHRARSVVGSGTTAADGSVSITDTPSVTTVYRLVVRHSTGVPRGTSPAVRVHVRAPSSLSIRGRHVRAGFLVSGVLRGNHHTVKHALVNLETLAADGVTWTVVTTGLSNHRGKVAFLQPESAGASYRLTYAGNDRLAPCISGTVVS